MKSKLILTLVALMAAGAASAADVTVTTYTWVGTGTTGSWSTAANWQGGNPGNYPVSNNNQWADDVIFSDREANNTLTVTSTGNGNNPLSVRSIDIGNNVAVKVDVGSDKQQNVYLESITLGAGATFQVTSGNSIGFEKDMTLNYEIFGSAAGYVEFDGMTRLWGNNHTITMIGTLSADAFAGQALTIDLLKLDVNEAAGIDASSFRFNTERLDVSAVQGASIVKTYQDGVYTVSIQVVPEPATATLSLLALAGLATRRRRK